MKRDSICKHTNIYISVIEVKRIQFLRQIDEFQDDIKHVVGCVVYMVYSIT